MNYADLNAVYDLQGKAQINDRGEVSAGSTSYSGHIYVTGHVLAERIRDAEARIAALVRARDEMQAVFDAGPRIAALVLARDEMRAVFDAGPTGEQTGESK